MWNNLAKFGLPTPPPGRTIRDQCPRPECARKLGLALAITADSDGCGTTWICHRCGWTGGERDSRATERQPLRQAHPPAQSNNLPAAQAIWRDTIPAANTLTDLWLGSRGIRHAIPAAVRHHRALPYHGDGRGICWPGMVTRLEGPDGSLIGVHRTYLDGSVVVDAVGKAPVAIPRKVFGTMGLAWFGRRDAEAIVAGEGIETILAARELGRDQLPPWGCRREPDDGPHRLPEDPPEPYGCTAVACICAAGLARFDPPEAVRRLYIAEDNDEAGRRAAAELAGRASSRGIAVTILRAPR